MIPLYSEWGIPLSIWSFLGNIIFAPFLGLFLILSLILFLGFIFNLTFYPILIFIKKFLKIWIYLMNFVNEETTFYIYFKNHSWIYYFFSWFFFIILVFFNLRNKLSQIRYFFLSIFFLLFLFFLSFFIEKKNILIIEDDFSQKISILHKTKNGIHIFDYKTKVKDENKFKNYLIYNLLNEYNKNFGNERIISYHFKNFKNNIYEKIKNYCKIFFSKKISIYNFNYEIKD